MADDRILLNPDNRLLGSSTGDFSLYGGQSDDGFVVREARSDDLTDAGTPGTQSGGTAAPASGATTSQLLSFSDAVSSDAAPLGAGAPASFLFGTPTTAFQPAAPDGAAQGGMPEITPFDPAPLSGDAVPQPTGSGSVAPLPPLGTDAAAASPVAESLAPIAPALVSGIAAPTLESTTALIDGLVQTPAAVLGGVADIAPALADGVVVPALDAAADLVEGIVDAPVAAVDPVIAGTAEIIEELGEAPGAVAATVVDPALDGVAAVTEPLLPEPVSDTLVAPALDLAEGLAQGAGAASEAVTGDVVAPAIAATAEPLEALASEPASIAQGVVSPITETAGDTVSATVGASGDTLDGLAGSDPEGGVATLVSLVSAADMFDLQPADTQTADAASDPGLGVLDLLVGEDGDHGLLGGHHDDSSGSDGGSDHHPFGL